MAGLVPTKIQLDRKQQQLVLHWPDGVCHCFPWSYLRANCPSATEKEARQRATMATTQDLGGSLPMLTRVPSTELLQVRTVGNYALGFTWADGHHTGIYPYEFLLQLAENDIVGKTTAHAEDTRLE